MLQIIASNFPSDSTSEKSLSFSFQFSEPSIERSTEFDIVTMSGLESIGDTGKPVLPVKPINILLPPNAEIEDIIITHSNPGHIPGNYFVKPMQPQIPLSEYDPEENYEFTYNKTLYNSAENYPEKLYENIGIQTQHGYDILIINLFPVRYLPVERQINYYPQMNIEIKTETGKTQTLSSSESIRGLSKDSASVMEKVINPENVVHYQDYQTTSKNEKLGDFSSLSLVDPSETYEYVIITTENLKNANGEYTFQDLVNSKIAKGLNATIVTVEDITSDHDYFVNGIWGDNNPSNPFYQGSPLSNPSLFNDTPAKIRNFIRDAYWNWNTEYILIGGDDDILEARDLYVEAEDEVSYNMPGDIYFQCLDGTWNFDEDDQWGEPSDGYWGNDVDLLSEISIGRSCASNHNEVNNFVKKAILYYESTNSAYLDYSLFVGENLDQNPLILNYWGGDSMDELIDECNSNGYSTNGIPSDEYKIKKLYDKDYRNFDWPKSELINRINCGVHMINHLGHSNFNNNMKLSISDVDDLVNDKYFFAYSQGCNSGGFDNPNGQDSISEHFILKSENAAFAGIWNTRYGWGVKDSTDGPSQHYHREFWDAIFGEEIKSIGAANQDSKEDNLHLINQNCMRWCYYEITLFGDPELELKSSSNKEYPALKFKLHRIKTIDPLEGFLQGESDLYYYIGFSEDGSNFEWRYSPVPYIENDNDIYPDEFYMYESNNDIVHFSVIICEDDFLNFDELADVSSDPNGGADDKSDPYIFPPEDGPYPGSYVGSWNMITNTLSGDITYSDGQWKVSSGNYDGSTNTDENDAKIWFKVYDTYEPPISDFTYIPTNPTDVEIVQFTDESVDSDGAIVNWTWNFDDGNISYSQNPSHQFSDDGTYNVTLIVKDDENLTDSITKTITVSNVKPTSNFSFTPSDPKTIDSISFIDESIDVDGSIVNITWDFDDGNISYLQNPIHQYSLKGTFNVNLAVVDDDGATSSTEKTVQVMNTLANAAFSISQQDLMAGRSISFIDDSSDYDGTIVNWTWNFDDGNISYLQNPEKIYSSNGTYIVTLTVLDNDGDSNSTSSTITVEKSHPIADFTFSPPNPLVGETVYFSYNASDPDGYIVNYSWKFDNGNLTYEMNPIYTYHTPGQHTASLRVTDDDNLTIIHRYHFEVNVKPNASFSYYPTNPTTYDDINFYDTSQDEFGEITTWHWNFGNGNSSSSQFPTHQYSESGDYTVTLNVTDCYGEWNTTSQTIQILNSPPLANFTFTPKIATVNQPISFTDISSDIDGVITNWTWDFDDGNTSYDQHPTHSYKRYETKTITLTVNDDEGNNASISKKLIMKQNITKNTENNSSQTLNYTSPFDALINITTTNSTNVTVTTYTDNPLDSLSLSNLTALNKYLDVEIENESRVDWPMMIRIFYTGEKLNNSRLNESQILGACFYNNSSFEWQLFNDTGVNSAYNGQGYDGYVWVNAWHLTNISIAADDIPPTQVTGLKVTDAKDGKLDISWSEAVDNIIIDHYEIYRDSKLIQTSSFTSFRDTGLKDGKSYSYQIAAVDSCGNRGDLSNTVNGKPTSSTENTPPSGGGGGTFIPPGPSGSGDKAPIANISIDSLTGFVGDTIVFDGSNSYDEEGNITSWEWYFGDGTKTNGSIVSHEFQKTGMYKISLTVRDESDNYDTCQINIQIIQPNRPPEMITFIGPTNGSVNVSYEYSFSARDVDNDSLFYVINWGDDSKPLESNIVQQNESIVQNHDWKEPGVYLMSVYAIDSQNATSSVREKLMLIDVMFCQDIGYFIDEDQDGEFDRLYCNETKKTTTLGQKNDSYYLLDVDGDGEWDYSYTIGGGLASIGLKKADDTPGFELFFILFLLLFIGIWKKKKGFVK